LAIISLMMFVTIILVSTINYMNENKWRVPMADTYNVVNQKTRVTSWGRPVTGAYFIKLLETVIE
ncbi:MAG: DUF1793 domain-containing protein, partial [Bacteroides sp.]|nr:DUF1793 domain-containing protein [Bacteroides sp.]